MTVKSQSRVLFNSGSWLPLGHASIPPKVTAKFGVARYSKDEQAANPTEPMTRMVKDVLRVGRWKVGMNGDKPVLWNVEPATLTTIAHNYLVAQHRGIAMNLTKSHGNLETGIVPTDDLIRPLDEVVVDGNTLWISTYVTPEEERYLTNTARKVSPYVMSNWIDGLGNVYSEMLLHVAVTDQPILPGQGPFVAMANSQGKGANAMDLGTLLPLINELLAAAGGPQLPEETDETNIAGYLKMAISMVAGVEEPEEETGEETPVVDGSAEGGVVLPGAGAAMNNRNVKAPAWAAGLFTAVKSLSNAVVQLQSGTVDSRKSAYMAKLVELATSGKINPVQRAHLEKVGPVAGYALSNLAVFELNAAQQAQQPGGKAAKALANAAAPAVEGDGKAKMTPEEHAESLKKRGLKPIELH